METKYRIRRFVNDQALLDWLNSGKVKEENIVSIIPFFAPGANEPSYCVLFKRKGV